MSGVLWSEGHREVLVAQGFPQNQLVLLQYPSLQCVAELKGHEVRILHTFFSPDGTIYISPFDRVAALKVFILDSGIQTHMVRYSKYE